MPSIEETAYPRLKSNPSLESLETIYTPTAEEIALTRRTVRGELATVSFLVLLKTFQTVGYLMQIAQVPNAIIRHIATCVNIALSPEDIAGYDTSGTRRRHLSAIRQHLDVQPFSEAARNVMTAAMEAVQKRSMT